MEKMSNLKKKIKNGEKTIGMHICLDNVSLAKIAGASGYDFIWIDLEHTSISPESLLAQIIAVKAGGADCIVRVPQNDFTYTKKVLEMGADGIIFPMIRSVKEAKALIDYTLYPPYGNRGFGPLNAVGYGAEDIGKYILNTRENLCRFIQIEHIDAFNCLDELVKNPFIDGYIFGPKDLSGSINELGKDIGKKTIEIIKESIKILKESGKYAGLSVGYTTEENLKFWHDLGIDMISSGADYEFVYQCAIKNRCALEKVHKKNY